MEAERYRDTQALNSTFEQIQEESIRQQKLKSAFNKLSETCQQLLELIIHQKNTKEILSTMGMNQASTLYRRKNACINRWRELYAASHLKTI